MTRSIPSFLGLFIVSCTPTVVSIPTDTQDTGITGGGEDSITINLPFAAGEEYLCTQGAGGSYSHTGTSTRYDADFDTPNDIDVPVFAPVSGTAYVHDTDADVNFGYHINIDLGDGTYIILGHLSEIFIDSGSEVAAGQFLAYEGETGNASGDHIHIGRHSGTASKDGIKGASIKGLSFVTADMTTDGDSDEIAVTDLTCDLTRGHLYQSQLPVVRMHPNGTLVKTPDDAAVYLIDGDSARPFITETSFLTRNYDFDNVALITTDELTCLGEGEGIADDTQIFAVVSESSSTSVWLLFGTTDDGERYRLKVPTSGWQGILKSWGITASTYDDLLYDTDFEGGIIADYPKAGTASYRDGSLVSPIGKSDVYLMSDGIAMPIVSWDTYLMLGFSNRTVIEVDEDDFEDAVSTTGSCSTDLYCLSPEVITECAADEEDLTYTTAGELEEEEEEEEEEESQGSGTPDPTQDEDDESDGEDADESGTSDVEEGDESDTCGSTGDVLVLTWTTPDAERADRITLSGEFTDASGDSSGWTSELAEVEDATSITYTRSMSSGDSLRFSVEFVIDGATSWSCLAPFPSGTVQGEATAYWDGCDMGVTPTDDPTSDGCGLTVTAE